MDETFRWGSASSLHDSTGESDWVGLLAIRYKDAMCGVRESINAGALVSVTNHAPDALMHAGFVQRIPVVAHLSSLLQGIMKTALVEELMTVIPS